MGTMVSVYTRDSLGRVVTVRSSDASVSGSARATWTGLLVCRCAKPRRCSAYLRPVSTRRDGGCLEIPPGRALQIANETARRDRARSRLGISR
jgi:hypothetical protein